MKATTATKAIMLFFAFAFISMMGFAQNDDRKVKASEASLSLTETMTDGLDLADTQKDSVAQCNLSYALSLFTTDPLTDEAMGTFEATLDDCLKEILDENQYEVWTKNRKDWLDSVKADLPVKAKEEEKVIDELENIQF